MSYYESKLWEYVEVKVTKQLSEVPDIYNSSDFKSEMPRI